jgi:hypothetical protein
MTDNRFALLLCLLVSSGGPLLAQPASYPVPDPSLPATTSYEDEIAQWRRLRLAALTADGGWLTVTGRAWLHQGRNTFGTAKHNDIVLADGAAHAGTIDLAADKLAVQMEGPPRFLRPNSGEGFHVGRLELSLFGGAGTYQVRIKDPQSAIRRDFHGIDSYPVREEYRVTAQFVPAPRQMGPLTSPGYVAFNLHGRAMRLCPVLEQPGAGVLLIVFRDLTAGKETYAGGRFLDLRMPRGESVVLDFNKAYNPPCAFTPYVDCPVPPRQNRLPVRIEAGERKYAH